jgi:hypothetical protein
VSRGRLVPPDLHKSSKFLQKARMVPRDGTKSAPTSVQLCMTSIDHPSQIPEPYHVSLFFLMENGTPRELIV